MAEQEQTKCEKPCPQCPWRISNQGKRHWGGFYTRANLTRLWGQIRKGGGVQSCHLTDPQHPDHIKAGASELATPKECPGSVILVLREMSFMCTLGHEPGEADELALARYFKARGRAGLNKMGFAYWILSRVKMGGIPFLGGPKLPKVDVEDPEIGLPEYLRGGLPNAAAKETPQ
jgi:hypothetical protein